MADRKDPFRNSRFIVEVDGVSQAGFREATIPDTSSEPIEYREGNEPPTVRKIPGLIKYGNISLKWGITDSLDMYNWYKDAILDNNFNGARKNISVLLLDEKGEEVNRWNFTNCWPTKYNAPDTNATANEIAIEEREIVTEGMIRDK